MIYFDINIKIVIPEDDENYSTISLKEVISSINDKYGDSIKQIDDINSFKKIDYFRPSLAFIKELHLN